MGGESIKARAMSPRTTQLAGLKREREYQVAGSGEMAESTQQPGADRETMVDKPVESSAQVAPDAGESGVRELIGKLLKARKNLALYPQGNPAVRAAMQQCEEAQSEAIRKHGVVNLLISRDQFFVGNHPLFPPEFPERRFAAELFVLGVRQLSFTGEAGAPEFEEFMELLREAQDDPALFMAALSGSGPQRMKGIELDRISDLEVVDELSLADEIDLAFRRTAGQDESERDSAAVVKDLYALILPGTLQPTQVDKLLENPARIQEAFGRLARAREGTGDGEVATEVAAKVLRDIASAVGSAPLKERKRLYRTTAELLLDIPDPLRMQLVFEKILPQATSDSPESALICSLSDEEIVELLTTRVPLHEGALRAVSSSFRNLDLSLPRRESILRAIRERAAVSGPQSSGYTLLFDSLSSAAEVKATQDDSSSASEQETRAPIPSVECLQLTREETSQIEQALKSIGMSQKTENIPAMLDLLHLEKDLQRYRNLLSMLETLREETLREGRVDLALKVIKGFAVEKDARKKNAEEREMCERLLEGAVRKETITLLAEMSMHYDRSSPEYSLILDYLHTVPEHAYQELLHRLEEEKSKSLRLAIRGLLIALGDTNIASLSSRVLDERWFVARNAVSILGEIGGESALEALATALGHEEPRVRREAVNALGKIGGEGSAHALATALDDSDNDVALCAARWLTMRGDVAPTDGLILIVESGRFRRIDLEIVLLAVRTVARNDGAEGTSFLRKIARKRMGSLFGSGRRIAASAAQALREKGV